MKCKICKQMARIDTDLCWKCSESLEAYMDHLKSVCVPSLYYELVNRWIHRHAEANKKKKRKE